MIVNSTGTGINRGARAAHRDVLQYDGWSSTNVIMYGLRADESYAYPNGVQGLFIRLDGHTLNGMAVVDCVFANAPSWSRVCMVEGMINHMFVKNTRFLGPATSGWAPPLDDDGRGVRKRHVDKRRVAATPWRDPPRGRAGRVSRTRGAHYA